MQIKNATLADFDQAFHFIQKLWSYNRYDRSLTLEVYERVLAKEDTFAFFLLDEEGNYIGFCHGDIFDTFWMCGKTCYISSLIVEQSRRGKGYGVMLVDHAKELAQKEGCKAMILDSGIPRSQAHDFYEKYGFDKSCYGFEYDL